MGSRTFINAVALELWYWRNIYHPIKNKFRSTLSFAQIMNETDVIVSNKNPKHLVVWINQVIIMSTRKLYFIINKMYDAISEFYVQTGSGDFVQDLSRISKIIRCFIQKRHSCQTSIKCYNFREVFEYLLEYKTKFNFSPTL